jgi:ferritin-like metal-binding protein YciE
MVARRALLASQQEESEGKEEGCKRPPEGGDPNPQEPFMKMFSANLDNLRKLYINQLRALLSTEEQITEALPTMIEKSTDMQLKQAFQSHLQETREQAKRLEQILNQATGEAKPVQCKVAAALISAAEDMVKDAADDAVRDAALISAGQRVEHFEIATYGAARHWAQLLGESAHAELLDKTIREEGHADHLLTEISNRVSPYAEKAA